VRLLAWAQRRRTPRQIPDPASLWGKGFNLDEKQFVELDGFGLYVMPDDYIGASIIASKVYEPHVTRLLRNELRPGNVFLDVGANVGFFTLLASHLVGPSGKVLGFEPNPTNLQLIYSSIRANNAENVRIFPFAASNEWKLLSFANVGSNGVVVTERATEKHVLYVPAAKIDSLLCNEPRIDFVKIDIEAHEPYALRGMTGLIEKHRPRIATEFHPWAIRHYNGIDPAEYVEQILRFGYKLSVIEELGELLPVSSAGDVMARYQAYGEETRHLDLLAEP
jgi:FkbM family methyltransferase